jgi:hypothetical protein
MFLFYTVFDETKKHRTERFFAVCVQNPGLADQGSTVPTTTRGKLLSTA